jgi:predicted nucleic acid-binding Zn ribbon protein
MTCATCGTVFEARRNTQRFCSAACRLSAFHAKEARTLANQYATIRLLLSAAQASITEAEALLTALPPHKECSTARLDK